MASLFSTTSGVAVVDTRTRAGTITLPLTTQIPNRYLQIKDLYGSFGASTLTLSTQTGESFDDRTTSKILTDPFSYMTLYAASTGRWAVLGATQTIQQTVSSLVVSSITIGSGSGWLQLPPIQTIALSTNTIYADTITTNSTTSMYVSAQILYVSSIMGAVVGGNVTTANLTSTVQGLGTAGYISSAGATNAAIVSTVIGLGTAGYISSATLNSTVQGLATAGYLSSVSGATGFVSSLTVNALTLGAGSGWLQLPPIQTLYASTTYVQGQALFSLSSYFGNTSTATALQFYGLLGNYNNTVLAEISTGTGTQEFLVFKGSSTSDRVRIQTTGNFVVETGVSARLWDGSTVPTVSNATPALIINTSSNVGIQTATPGAPLDVAGTGRFQLVSTLGLNICTINGQTFGGPINSTVIGLGTAGYISTQSLTSTTFGLNSNISTTFSTLFATAGNYTGEVLYLNYSVAVGSYKELNVTPTSASLQTVGVSVNGNSSSNLTSFQSVFSLPAFIPPGLWDMNLFCSANSDGSLVYFELYTRTSGGSETLVASGSNAASAVPTSLNQVNLTLSVPYTTLPSGGSIVIKIYGSNTKGSSATVTTYYEGTSYSHLHTSFGTLLPDSYLTSSLVGLGTLGYLSSIPGVVSTPNLVNLVSTANLTNLVSTANLVNLVSTSYLNSQLVSTVVGLGSAGYVSSGGGGGGDVTQGNLLSTVGGLGTAGYISTLEFSQYAYYTVLAGTSYTAEPWGEQIITLNSLNSTNAPLTLTNSDTTLELTRGTAFQFRIDYMTGGNAYTTSVVRPTITMVISTPTDITYYPTVENFEGGGGSVTFIQTISKNTWVYFTMRGLSNYTFGTIDQNLYRMSFEKIGEQVVYNVLSNLSSVSSIIDNLYTNNARVTQELIVNLSSISKTSYTEYLRSLREVITSNVRVSTVNILDQSTLTFIPLSISSGSIYLNNVLASAGGSGSGGAGGSTLSSLFVGSQSTQNFIKFWGQVGEYNNTVIAQQSTGTATSEFLFFEGSSVNDQFRFQTTGGIRFETGASGPRNINTATQLATPSMIINSSSNVGILTANPTFNLDVAGTGRFQTLLSTQSMYAGALYYGIYYA